MIAFDDAVAEHSSVFSEPIGVIRADTPEDVIPALASMVSALDRGEYLAGFFSYELGYVLEDRLVRLLPAQRGVPLLWFEIFAGPPQYRTGDALWPEGKAYAGPIRWEWDKADYASRFNRIAEWIKAGDIYQANLSMRGRFRFIGDPRALFRNLRKHAGAAHGAYIDANEFQILSVSPELFFELAPDGTLTTKPMKGTKARGQDDETDRIVRAELAASEKDRAENLMIVDLFRNDLTRIAKIPSVQTSGLFDIETYPTLHQMVSTVTAKIPPRLGIDRILAALFPSGSVTGAPKIRAMEIIAATERSPRGAYCGAVGHFAPDGSARFNVAIRTLTLSGGYGEIGVGGALVADSQCDAEYEECLLKARYFERARRPLALIETLHGRHRIDLHLDRMQNSAAWLDIPFDRTMVEKAAAAAGEELVRLVLQEDGRLSVSADRLPSGQDVWRFRISARRVDSSDPFIRHKTGWREHYDEALRLSGCDEVLFLNERGEICEGSRSNVFLVIDGVWLTPAATCGLLNGCLRREMLACGRCQEATLTIADMERSEEVWFGNSLRGLIRAAPLTDPGPERRGT